MVVVVVVDDVLDGLTKLNVVPLCALDEGALLLRLGGCVCLTC